MATFSNFIVVMVVTADFMVHLLPNTSLETYKAIKQSPVFTVELQVKFHVSLLKPTKYIRVPRVHLTRAARRLRLRPVCLAQCSAVLAQGEKRYVIMARIVPATLLICSDSTS